MHPRPTPAVGSGRDPATTREWIRAAHRDPAAGHINSPTRMRRHGNESRMTGCVRHLGAVTDGLLDVPAFCAARPACGVRSVRRSYVLSRINAGVLAHQ
jgi:hypothetical protein